MEKQDRLMANARAHLQAAFEAINEVSNMHWNSDKTLENLMMRAGALHNDVANYGKVNF